jgi:hypothetical protein
LQPGLTGKPLDFDRRERLHPTVLQLLLGPVQHIDLGPALIDRHPLVTKHQVLIGAEQRATLHPALKALQREAVGLRTGRT